MNNKVLYFPYISVPNSTWFTRMLLYWDEVGAIVPCEYIENPDKLGVHTKNLVEAGLVRQVIPAAYTDNIPAFRESFLHYLESYGNDKLNQRRNSFQRGHVAHIHIEKMDDLKQSFVTMGLAKSGYYPWFDV